MKLFAAAFGSVTLFGLVLAQQDPLAGGEFYRDVPSFSNHTGTMDHSDGDFLYQTGHGDSHSDGNRSQDGLGNDFDWEAFLAKYNINDLSSGSEDYDL